MFLCYILLIDQISLSGCFYFSRYWSICILQLFVNQATHHKIWNQPCLSNQAVLLHDQKVKIKILISWERKELLRWNKKEFSSISRLSHRAPLNKFLTVKLSSGFPLIIRRSTRWCFYNIYIVGIKNICKFCSINDNFFIAFYYNVFIIEKTFICQEMFDCIPKGFY